MPAGSDDEALGEPGWWGPSLVHVIHARSRRTRAGREQQAKERVLPALGDDAHGTVRLVRDPAAEPQRLRLVDDEYPEAHALDPTLDPQLQPALRHAFAGQARPG